MRCAKELGLRLVCHPGLHDDEFVAAEPRYQVFDPRQGVQPFPNRAEQEIAAVVAERVVDLLEVIDIDEMHGDHAAAGRSTASAASSRSIRRARLARPVNGS